MTSADDIIENKKYKNSSNTSDIYKSLFIYIILVFILLLIVIGYFSFSGLILYLCKLCETNFFVETCTGNVSNEKPVNIFEDNLNIKFNVDKNNSILFIKPTDSANKAYPKDFLFSFLKSKSNSSVTNYINSFLKDILIFNYCLINKFLKIINQSNLVVVLFGPILFSLVLILFYFINIFYLFYAWFANSSLFIKPQLRYLNPLQEFFSFFRMNINGYFLWMFWLFFTIIIGWIIYIVLNPVIVFLMMFLTVIAIFTSYKTKIVINNNEYKGSTILFIIKYLFIHYKILILSIFSILVILLTFINLGYIIGLVILGIFILIYLKIISINLFTSIQ